MGNQKCASNPNINCDCGRSWVCNNSNTLQSWPQYHWLSKLTLQRLRVVVIMEIEHNKDTSLDELEYLDKLINRVDNEK